ncbi:hypothetical protein BC834DRAFT_237320 [Gloeopeniophorella convolvens]|nr:hypothetical protein BC834DRAFT_237320 [Gloeopeniophorella convolvens]
MAPAGAETQGQAENRDEELRERQVIRKERAEDNLGKAEGLKELGNVYFRKGKYREAINVYELAVLTSGPRTPYFSNIAAAWLKLGNYDAADQCANTALAYDPQCIKARYRRGLARKGNLQLAAAAIDFRTVLKQDPSSAEAKTELMDTLALMRARNEKDGPRMGWEVIRDTTPMPDSEALAFELPSDSSDCRHLGNEQPCPSYNHDGCPRGTSCMFSHAPDYMSVRDGLGRNVCLDFLLGMCSKDKQCPYAHEKNYLPHNGWWNIPMKQSMYRSMSLGASEGDSPRELRMQRIMEMEECMRWNTPASRETLERIDRVSSLT